jgi:hypothetical protein
VRFGYLVLAGMAALAGFGLAVLRGRWADRPRLALAVSVAALALATIEAARLPVGYTAPHVTPAAYRVLAAEPVGALVELPLYPPKAFFRNGTYMLHATRHWKPMLNGYSGFRPASYATHWEASRTFPDERSLDYLRSVGVTHVAVHANAFVEVNGAERLKQIANTPALRIAVQSGTLTIYRLGPKAP